MGRVNAKLRSSPVSREVGMAGGGFASATGGVTDEFNVDREASRILESGRGSLLGAILPARKGASGEDIRTHGVRSGEMQSPGSSAPSPWRRHASRFLRVVVSPSTFVQPTDPQISTRQVDGPSTRCIRQVRSAPDLRHGSHAYSTDTSPLWL